MTSPPTPFTPPWPAAPAAPQREFLNVGHLLEASQLRQPFPRSWLFMGAMGLTMGLILLSSAAGNRPVVEAVSSLLIGGLMIGLMVYSSRLVRRYRAEQQRVDALGELVQLRRWTEAGGELEQYLSSPVRTEGLRAQALIYLAAVLSRYGRFEDAITVHNYLIEEMQLDPASNYGVRLGRAMAMLRVDHLVDADRAISELKRMTPAGADSAGLALLELYRDIRTGHADDAVVRFEKSLPALREQLGHRAADAWALAARAYDQLGRSGEAAKAFRNATLLAPPPELYRRYPEFKKLEGRYEPAWAPEEAA